MSHSLILITAAFAIAIIFPTPCRGAESKADEAIAFRTLCTESRDQVVSVVPPKGNSRKTVVPLYVGSFSELITAKFADHKAAFYGDGKQVKGKAGRKLMAEGPLATGSRQVFIVVPAKEDADTIYRIHAFDDSDGVFPMGSTRVLNLTPFPLRLNVAGTEQEPIEPEGSAMYPICEDVDDWNMYKVGIDLKADGKQWQTVATQSWKASDRKRDWVVVTYDAATKQPTVRLYQDVPPWMAVDLTPDGRKSAKERK
jgi:hypothetical protein